MTASGGNLTGDETAVVYQTACQQAENMAGRTAAAGVSPA
jgi:hypothetical protein